jgi:hypothetical protein
MSCVRNNTIDFPVFGDSLKPYFYFIGIDTHQTRWLFPAGVALDSLTVFLILL